MKKICIILVLLWGISMYPAYHYSLGFFIHDFPDQCSAASGLGFSIAGPEAIILNWANGGGLYWAQVPLSREDRLTEFQERFGTLGEEYFNNSSDSNCPVDDFMRKINGLDKDTL